MFQTTSTLLVAIAFCSIAVMCAHASARNQQSRRSSPFLISGRSDAQSRRQQRQSECTFDQRSYEIGATWFPDFGPPVGINYCFRCECRAYSKQRRILAKSSCTNIQTQCPVTACAQPVKLPGRCCLVCPGAAEPLNSPDLQFDTAPAEPESNATVYYAALLTGRTSQFLRRDTIKSMYTLANPQNIVANGRFTYSHRDLYYSFAVSAKSAHRPRIIQFIDGAGSILQENSLVVPPFGPLAAYQNATGKTCGVWRRMSADARKLLRTGQLSVVLLWGGPRQRDLALAGRVSNYTALPDEHYSALLEAAPGTKPEHMRGSGGSAIVSTVTGQRAAVNVTVVFNGIFGARDVNNVGVRVRLESGNGTQVVDNQTFVLDKPAADYNEVTFSAHLSAHDLRLLSQGQLQLVVESARNRNLRLRGNVTTRGACELFQNVLAPATQAEKNGSAARNARELAARGSTGLAWMYVDAAGDLHYFVRTDGVASTAHFAVFDAKNRNRQLQLDSIGENRTAEGVALGFGPRFIETLYGGQLNAAVRSAEGRVIVRGRMVRQQVAEARETIEPVLLKRIDAAGRAAADLHAMVWLAVDNECTLRLEATLSQQRTNRTYQLLIADVPFVAPGAPIRRRVLGTFHSQRWTSSAEPAMTAAELMRLETHVTHVFIQSGKRPLLRGLMRKMKVPAHCAALPDEESKGRLSDGGESQQHQQPMRRPCFESGRFHRDGAQWRSEEQVCSMCSCLHGEVQCEAEQCPPLLCKAEERVQRVGECCATCASAAGGNSTIGSSSSSGSGSSGLPKATSKPKTERGCRLGQQFHKAGATFHPYLPPNSYDTCTICTCDALTLTVACPRVQCPPLACDESVAVRPDRKSCCKQCPEPEAAEPADAEDSELMQDEPALPEPAALLRTPTLVALESEDGGCTVGPAIYANGQQWNPRFTFGVKRCIVCRCLGSRVECDAPRQCTPSVCSELAASSNTEQLLSNMLAERQRNPAAVTEDCCLEQCQQKH